MSLGAYSSTCRSACSTEHPRISPTIKTKARKVMWLEDAFDPAHLTPNASLNRVRIVDLPGVALESYVRGKTGFELLSSRSISAYVREHAVALGMTSIDAVRTGDASDTDDSRTTALLLAALDRSFRSADRGVREAAETVAQRFGHHLAYLLLTLQRGDQINRRARPDWDERHWAHWAGIRTVWLGGGIAGGDFGRHLCDAAARVFREQGAADLTLRVAEHAANLPLLGAARSASPDAAAALVFDFGGTWVKRAIATYERGTLTGLQTLSPLPAPELADPPENVSPEAVERVAEQMAGIVAQSWAAARSEERALSSTLVVSLATYVRDGHPLVRQGGVYAALAALPERAADRLSRRLSAVVGRSLEIELVHDGTAAARVFAGQGRTAVVMLGTALGVGFPPRTDEDLRPDGREFRVIVELTAT
jgi:hypothetical protein